jgi:transposase
MFLTKDFFNLISDFGDDWVIDEIDANHYKKEVYLKMRYCNDKYFDPDSEQECKLYDHAPERIWRHLDLWDYKSYIICSLPRIINSERQVKTIRLGWADKHDRHTYSFEIKVIDTLQATKNQTKTAELLRCSFRLVNRIIHQCTERGMLRREIQKHPIEHISIDEKSFKKGHKYVTVISHPRSGCVLDVGENRDEHSVIELMSRTFSKKQLSNIKTVCMDMWKSYMNAVSKSIPQAEIVHDKFHLIKYLNEAIDKIRRREVKENEILKYSKYTLLKSEEKRTEFQKDLFDEIMKSNLEVAKAHYAKETFKSLFNKHNDDYQAKENLKNWATTFYMMNISEINKVILMMLSHINGVVNAMISNHTNAMAERLNGKIQEIKLCGRGYRTFSNFRSAILFFHGGLQLYPLKW